MDHHTNSQRQFLGDDLLLEIGRIAALRGNLRFLLLTAADALLSARVGGWGAGRVLLAGKELPEICRALHTVAEAAGIASEPLKLLDKIAREHHEDFAFSAAIANGNWTYLGGIDGPLYGLYEREILSNGQLAPEWRPIRIEDLEALRERLEGAAAKLRPLPVILMNSNPS